jgi:HNH endonuclease
MSCIVTYKYLVPMVAWQVFARAAPWTSPLLWCQAQFAKIVFMDSLNVLIVKISCSIEGHWKDSCDYILRAAYPDLATYTLHRSAATDTIPPGVYTVASDVSFLPPGKISKVMPSNVSTSAEMIAYAKQVESIVKRNEGNFNAHIDTRDQTCLISGEEHHLEHAHIVAYSMGHNKTNRFGLLPEEISHLLSADATGINSSCNGLLLSKPLAAALILAIFLSDLIMMICTLWCLITTSTCI